MGLNKTSLDIWGELVDRYDLIYYNEFQILSKSDLEQMREDWKAMRRFALSRLNDELNKLGREGRLLNIDVSDEQLYLYVDNKNRTTFFKYSRILDFSDGYKPRGFVLIKKLFCNIYIDINV